MILSKTIIIKLHKTNTKYYESLGYFIPRYRSKNNQYYVKTGTYIEIKIKHLPPKSTIKILCKCDICGKERLIRYSDYSNICHKCSVSTPQRKQLTSKLFKGKPKSNEQIMKMKQNSYCLGKYGKNHPKYKHQLTDKERHIKRSIVGYYQWQQSILKRDKYICQKCNHIGKPNDGFMYTHHINNFANFKEQRTDVNNGIVLCKQCHDLFHHIFGQCTNQKHFIKFMRQTKIDSELLQYQE